MALFKKICLLITYKYLNTYIQILQYFHIKVNNQIPVNINYNKRLFNGYLRVFLLHIITFGE